VIAFLIARSIVRPIRALSEGARRIAQGETDVEIPSSAGTDEIGVSLYAGDPQAFFDDADRALYRAKDAGKDCVVCERESRES
jgi:nitrogen fixation/metabolism regulation signal transduction histidine kinase